MSLINQGERSELKALDEFLTIGRGSINHFQLEDPFVSTRHARIEKTPRGYLLRDLRSRNGTLLNGARVLEALLSDGDQIQVGKCHLQFEFEPDSNNKDKHLRSDNRDWNAQLQSLPQMASTDYPVLILGESGTGKELIAKAIHKFSDRNFNPMISVNCSALSESLVESELFGHRKGSFTGATDSRKGAFEAARGSTLFGRSWGSPNVSSTQIAQSLREWRDCPVGSDQVVKTDVRIVAATHQI